ncbi:uncharacterized protein [Clytia hemisphaerica]|uniref:uncharacterized protein n=1 Tax=Clytia hemisphaerica TaxID=252671 RepID=UPI0034D5F744
MGTDVKELRNLVPQKIDDTKCTTASSLYEQINGSNTAQKALLKQQSKQWFNLGNSQTFNDPIQAAKYLLEREYGESFLFKPNCHKPIFIPSEFVSHQYCKSSATAILDFNIEQTIRNTLENLKKSLPDSWFTKDLDLFLQTQQSNTEINQSEYEKWISRVKAMYLITQELNIETLNLPSTTSKDFIQDSITELKNVSPNSNILSILASPKWRQTIKKAAIKSTPIDPIMSWFFNLNIADRGMQTEQSFFERLFSLKNDECLKDIVILSACNFMKDVSNATHQEFDMLILSGARKLIIAVEVKRSLSKSKPLEQLRKYQSIFEQQLGDQLGPGWTFFPVVCVEKDDTNFSNHHYIDLDTDIKAWISSILNKYPLCQYPTPFVYPIEQVKAILRLIIFTVHISRKDQPNPTTLSYWVDYVSNAINTLSNGRNIVFYSKQQLPVITSEDSSYKKLVFMAGFGTGKTFLLQEKAILLSKEDEYKERILYVVCNGKGLLYHDRKVELQKYGVTVISGDEAKESLKMAWLRNHFKAIFFDEWNEDIQNKLNVDWLNDFKVCWIAPNSAYRAKTKDLNLIKGHFTEFKVVQLTTNLRNTKEIVKATKEIAERDLYEYGQGVADTPPHFPRGLSPVFVSTFPEAVFEAKKHNQKTGILIIANNIKSLVPLKSLKEQVKFFHSSQNDFIKDNPCDFLRQGNILITSRNFISGFEWPVVIYEVDKTIDRELEYHECNVSMRCTTKVYVVGESFESDDTIPFVEILNLLQPFIEDNTFITRFKILASNYIFDHVNQFKRRAFLRYILPILKQTVQNLSKCEMKNFSLDNVFASVNELFMFIISNLTEEQLLSGENKNPVKGDAMLKKLINCDLNSCDNYEKFKEALVRNLNFQFLLNTFDDLYGPLSRLSEKAQCLFCNGNHINDLNAVLPSEFKLLGISNNDSDFLGLFKHYAHKYILDHLAHFKQPQWLYHIFPILERTVTGICEPNFLTFSENDKFSRLLGFLDFMIEDLVGRHKNLEENLCRNTIGSIMNVEFITNDDNLTKWFNSYLRFEELLKLSESFDIDKLTRILKEKPTCIEIQFWNKFESNPVPIKFLNKLYILHFSNTDIAFQKMFKVYATVYIRDRYNHYVRGKSEWLKAVAPVLEITLERIFKSNIKSLSKENIFLYLKSYLEFVISDTIQIEGWKNVTPLGIMNDLTGNNLINDKRFLQFHWLHKHIHIQNCRI